MFRHCYRTFTIFTMKGYCKTSTQVRGNTICNDTFIWDIRIFSNNQNIKPRNISKAYFDYRYEGVTAMSHFNCNEIHILQYYSNY